MLYSNGTEVVHSVETQEDPVITSGLQSKPEISFDNNADSCWRRTVIVEVNLRNDETR